jgi:hypothetical protein
VIRLPSGLYFLPWLGQWFRSTVFDTPMFFQCSTTQ